MRLIDADKLIKEGWVLERHGQSNVLLGIKSIADVPTAFDLDKVIEQLERLEDLSKCEYLGLEDETARGAMCAYASAIEIVRKGGIDH